MTTTLRGEPAPWAAVGAAATTSAHRTAHRRIASPSLRPGAGRLADLLQHRGQFLDLLRVLGREVGRLAEVVGQVEQQPAGRAALDALGRLAGPAAAAAGLDVLPVAVADGERPGRAAVDEHGGGAARLVVRPPEQGR